MKICGREERKEGGPHWVIGNVYRKLKEGFFDGGSLYLACDDGTLRNLSNGNSWAKGRLFDGDTFEDVTHLVCLDTSRLPPLEDT